MKTQMLAVIGETGPQPAVALNAGLAANARIKYAPSLLQMALSHAEHPEQKAPTLEQERIGCGIDDPELDRAVAEARMTGQCCHVPHAARILTRIAADLCSMDAPILASKPDGLAARLDGLLAALPTAAGDLLDLATLRGKPLEDLQALADLVAQASQECIKALDHATQIGGVASGAETVDFLTAIHRVAALEHQADAAERALAASAIQHAADFRQLHLFTAIGDRFEAAADALKHASQILRDHVLEDVIDPVLLRHSPRRRAGERRRAPPAARLRALRCRAVHARHDG